MNVPVAQTSFELEQMVRVCESLRPKRILEIGIWYGGTLKEWLRVAGVVVAVDVQMLDAERWQHWAHEQGKELVLIQGNSGSPHVAEKVAEHGPYDFAFIDGDHSYEGVRRDWETYGPMADVVAFHDILPRPHYGVSRLWEEIKQGRMTIEIVGGDKSEHMAHPHAGIGVVF